jgi:hypothetical protein
VGSHTKLVESSGAKVQKGKFWIYFPKGKGVSRVHGVGGPRWWLGPRVHRGLIGGAGGGRRSANWRWAPGLEATSTCSPGTLALRRRWEWRCTWEEEEAREEGGGAERGLGAST